jgi:hypothetical protein
MLVSSFAFVCNRKHICSNLLCARYDVPTKLLKRFLNIAHYQGGEHKQFHKALAMHATQFAGVKWSFNFQPLCVFFPRTFSKSTTETMSQSSLFCASMPTYITQLQVLMEIIHTPR